MPERPQEREQEERAPATEQQRWKTMETRGCRNVCLSLVRKEIEKAFMIFMLARADFVLRWPRRVATTTSNKRSRPRIQCTMAVPNQCGSNRPRDDQVAACRISTYRGKQTLKVVQSRTRMHLPEISSWATPSNRSSPAWWVAYVQS